MCFVLVNISAHAHDNTHAHTCSISLHLLLSARYFFLCSALLSSSSCTVLPSSSLPPGPSSTCRNIIKKHLASDILSLKCCQNDFLYQIFPKCRIKTEISDQNLNLSSDVQNMTGNDGSYHLSRSQLYTSRLQLCL